MENNGEPNKSLDVRAKELLFKTAFGKFKVARIRFRPTSIQSFGASRKIRCFGSVSEFKLVERKVGKSSEVMCVTKRSLVRIALL